MRRFAAVALMFSAFPALAGDWTPLSGEEIKAALTDRKLAYGGGVWQEFRASGKTLYFSGGDSWGDWAVRGDQYCSTWPPSSLWECFDMARRGDELRFIDAQGNTFDGVYSQ